MKIIKLILICDISCSFTLHLIIEPYALHRYTELDDQGAIASERSDSLQLKVIYQKYPQGRVNSGEYTVGQDVELSVSFELYPKPEESPVYWVVRDQNGDEQQIQTGQNMYSYKYI